MLYIVNTNISSMYITCLFFTVCIKIVDYSYGNNEKTILPISTHMPRSKKDQVEPCYSKYLRTHLHEYSHKLNFDKKQVDMCFQDWLHCLFFTGTICDVEENRFIKYRYDRFESIHFCSLETSCNRFLQSSIYGTSILFHVPVLRMKKKIVLVFRSSFLRAVF